MRHEVIKCDHCGKDITSAGAFSSSHIEFSLYYWHGGSIGGSEDEENFELDLCDDCSCELSGMIKRWIKKN